jgi:glycosyltransferase involved in cell wall biosynthesis
MREKLTTLILTYNEKENITRTLAALSSVEQIVLIDSSSTDGTAEIAQSTRPDIWILRRAFDTHTQQWNFGLDQIQTEWVLTLDADYELSPEIQSEITRLEPPPDVVGYSADFEYRIFGLPLRASSYPPRVVLFRVAAARYVDDGHTQLLKPNGRVERLAGKIYHDDRKPLSHWIQAQDRYAILEARHLRSMSLDQLSFQDRLRRKVYFAPVMMFIYLLFVRGLILDGWPGWYYVFQRTLAEMLLSLRLLTERERLESRG